jgi:hypothetical protein
LPDLAVVINGLWRPCGQHVAGYWHEVFWHCRGRWLDECACTRLSISSGAIMVVWLAMAPVPFVGLLGALPACTAMGMALCADNGR